MQKHTHNKFIASFFHCFLFICATNDEMRKFIEQWCNGQNSTNIHTMNFPCFYSSPEFYVVPRKNSFYHKNAIVELQTSSAYATSQRCQVLKLEKFNILLAFSRFSALSTPFWLMPLCLQLLFAPLNHKKNIIV